MNRARRLLTASAVEDRNRLRLGCLAVSLVLGVPAVPLVLWRSPVGLLFLLPLVSIAVVVAYEKALLLRAAARAISGVLVTSDSSHWASRISDRWIPALPPGIVVVNHSERRAEVRNGRIAWALHRRFVGSERDFCPAVIVLRGLRHPLVFRFFAAFKEEASGRPEALTILESRLWGALRVAV